MGMDEFNELGTALAKLNDEFNRIAKFRAGNTVHLFATLGFWTYLERRAGEEAFKIKDQLSRSKP